MAGVTARMAPDIGKRTGHFGVLAAIAAFTDGEPWLDQLLSTLDARRTLLGELLRDRLPSVRWQPPEATYLAWLDCSAVGAGDTARDLFLKRGKVAPGTRFRVRRAGRRVRPAELRHEPGGAGAGGDRDGQGPRVRQGAKFGFAVRAAPLRSAPMGSFFVMVRRVRGRAVAARVGLAPAR